MKKIIHLLTMLCVTAMVLPAQSFSLEQITGSLEVRTQTTGTLYLDGKSMGRVPVGSRAKLTDIPAGQHSLEMRYGDYNEIKSITVEENRTLTVDFTWVELTDAQIGDYVLVEGGTFQMGSTDSDAYSNESPVHDVTVSSFYMKATEVTQGEWKAVMGNNPSHFKGNNRPVESVSWYDAVQYCNALSEMEGLTPVYQISGSSVSANWSADGYRLPTEAEWEYAARGGSKSRGYKYAGGNNVGEVGWYDDNSGDKTHSVGGKAANELGLYDMSGNVYEWCWDWKGNYSSGSQTDPIGPSSGSYRVLRGGGWVSSVGRYLRSALRDYSSPSDSINYLGFRPVRRT